ncbi:hypothetical protein JMUB6875_10380 [Nocardia sp. JMUB6875]
MFCGGRVFSADLSAVAGAGATRTGAANFAWVELLVMFGALVGFSAVRAMRCYEKRAAVLLEKTSP